MRKLLAALIMIFTTWFCIFLFFETMVNIVTIVCWYVVNLWLSAITYGD